MKRQAEKKSSTTYLVLLQHRTDSQYNDFIGKYYHFPKKYLGLLSRPGVRFVYYEAAKKGAAVYFGYGEINPQGIFKDKQVPDHFFAEVINYKSFDRLVDFKDADGSPRETGPGYNAQNAVRQIDQKTLDEICLDGGILLSFRADSHLVQILGEQLIASERVGILELVKNAYDAGASQCRVTIENVPGLEHLGSEPYKYNDFDGPVIVIEDNGKGMSREAIEYGWLRPASTIKTDAKARMKRERQLALERGTPEAFERFVATFKKTNNNRVPLGEKGVGRFASHRLGRYLLLTTKTEDIDYEYVLRIDWNAFDFLVGETKDLSDIGVSLSRQPVSRDYGPGGTGTRLIISGGRHGLDLSSEEIDEIRATLDRLNSPFPPPDTNRTSFSVIFLCPQRPPKIEEIEVSDIPAPFTVTGIVDEMGMLTYERFFDPPVGVPLPKKQEKDGHQLDLRTIGEDKKYWEAPENHKLIRKPVCGSFYVHVSFWYRSSPWVEGPKKKAIRDYLDRYGGLSVYRDGINVFSAEWGSENDWLELSKRHIKKGSNISYYSMIGNVEIEQTVNFDIVDKTNREGVIQNRAYNDFRKLLRGLLMWMELDVKGMRDKLSALTGDLVRDPSKLSDTARTAADILGRMSKSYDVEADPLNLLERLGTKASRAPNLLNLERSMKNLKKSVDVIMENQELMTEHAGYGIAVAVAMHEIAKTTANFYHGVNELLKSKVFDQEQLETMKEASESLRSELKRLSPLRAIKNEPAVTFKVSKVIRFCSQIFKAAFANEDITLEIDPEQDFDVTARYGALSQVITNLLDNSVYWLSLTPQQGRRIAISVNANRRTITVADSGAGIHDSILPYLFEPGYSLKFPPSGLGLYICKHYMRDMKGDIYLTNTADRLKNLSGAQFTLDFSGNKIDRDQP